MTTTVFLWMNYTKRLCPRPVAAVLLPLYDPFTVSSVCGKITKNGGTLMDKQTEELRAKYIKNPPEGMTAKDIREMSDDDLLDMDYFLNEDDEDVFGVEGFYIF